MSKQNSEQASKSKCPLPTLTMHRRQINQVVRRFTKNAIDFKSSSECESKINPVSRKPLFNQITPFGSAKAGMALNMQHSDQLSGYGYSNLTELES